MYYGNMNFTYMAIRNTSSVVGNSTGGLSDKNDGGFEELIFWFLGLPIILTVIIVSLGMFIQPRWPIIKAFFNSLI